MSAALLEEDCDKVFKQWTDHYNDVHDGYLNIKDLLQDTVVRLETDEADRMTPFHVHIDETVANKITIRSGQLKKKENTGKYIQEGIGRKVIIKYRSQTDADDNQKVVELIERQCHVYEGSFKNDQLSGFGRSVRGDLKQDIIGFFQRGKQHGYGRTAAAQSSTEGIFESGRLVLDHQYCKEQNDDDFSQQKFDLCSYSISMPLRRGLEDLAKYFDAAKESSEKEIAELKK